MSIKGRHYLKSIVATTSRTDVDFIVALTTLTKKMLARDGAPANSQ